MTTRVSQFMRGARPDERRVEARVLHERMYGTRPERSDAFQPASRNSRGRLNRTYEFGGLYFDASAARGGPCLPIEPGMRRPARRLAPRTDLPETIARVWTEDGSPVPDQSLPLEGAIRFPRAWSLFGQRLHLHVPRVSVPAMGPRAHGPYERVPIHPSIDRRTRSRLAELYRLTGDWDAVIDLASLDPLPNMAELDGAITWVERARRGEVSVAELISPAVAACPGGGDHRRLWEQLHTDHGWTADWVPMTDLAPAGARLPLARAESDEATNTFHLGLAPFPAPTLGLTHLLWDQWYTWQAGIWTGKVANLIPELQLDTPDARRTFHNCWAAIETTVHTGLVARHLEQAGYRVWMRPWRDWGCVAPSALRAVVAAQCIRRSPLMEHSAWQTHLAFFQDDGYSIGAFRRAEKRMAEDNHT